MRASVMQGLISNNVNTSFNKELKQIVVPIVFQNLISSLVLMADIFMLAFINQEAMAAVSLAGQVTFVLTLFYFSFATGVSILVAQYWGKKDIGSIQRVFSIGVMASSIISLIFFLLAFLLPKHLMVLITNDTALIEYGTLYLRPIAFCYIGMAFSQMYSSVLKSIENTRLSAWISSSSLILNVFLDGLVIFFIFPNQPNKAIVGVAIATVIARLIELLWTLGHSIMPYGISYKFFYNDDQAKILMKDFIHYTLPILGNYIVWGGGLTGTTIIIGHLNGDMVAANSIASVVRNLSIIICTAIGAGGAILIGKYLGENNREGARIAGRKISFYALVFGIVAGLFVLLLKPFVLRYAYLNNQTAEYLNLMLFVSVYYMVGKSLNSTIIGGIFPAGGDAKFGFICDLIVMWGIILPISYISAFILKLPPILIYVIISLDEFLKLPAAIIRYRQYRWLNNLTRKFS